MANHPAYSIPYPLHDKDEGPYASIDYHMIPVITELWEAKIATFTCCQGDDIAGCQSAYIAFPDGVDIEKAKEIIAKYGIIVEVTEDDYNPKVSRWRVEYNRFGAQDGAYFAAHRKASKEWDEYLHKLLYDEKTGTYNYAAHNAYARVNYYRAYESYYESYSCLNAFPEYQEAADEIRPNLQRYTLDD